MPAGAHSGPNRGRVVTGNATPTTGRSRARDGLPLPDRPVATGRVPPDESARLAATLGELLHRERTAAGWSTRRLAAAVGAARSTIRRLETGQRRPRPSLLKCIASVLAVDDPKPLADRLIAAAGDSIRADTDGTIRYRNRRANAALLAGRKPLPTDLARSLALHRQADAARARANELFYQPGALNDVDVLDEIHRLHDQARQLRAQAGPPFILRIGAIEIRAGLP